MKALVYEAPWQMPLREIERPRPGPKDIVVAVGAVGICGSDVHGFTGATGRRIPPMVMGHEVSGVVEAVGGEVADFRAGDRVVVQPLITCGECDNCRAGMPNICMYRRGIGMMDVNGAYAEAVQVPQQIVYRLPDEVSWEEGAMVEPVSVALHAVNRTPITLMDSVVILGAGTIGLLALQACRLKGAGRVIVSDPSAYRLEKARQLGADVLVNPVRQNLRDVVLEYAGRSGVAAVIEAVGITATAQQSLEIVRPGGNVTWIGNLQPKVEIGMQDVVTREITVHGAYGFNQEFPRAIEAIRSRRIDVKPLIERVAPLAEGPQIVHDLAKGKLEAVKIILKPGDN